MSRNIELKARCPDLARAGQIARDLGATLHGEECQRDTYFRVSPGRLKLRERTPGGSQLIWYQRPDADRPRGSDYTLIEVAQPASLRAILGGALGVVKEVVKERAVFLHENVRIHLDRVEGLGTFLEFEAIVDASCDDAAAHAKLDRLREAFRIAPDQIVARSYADL